jgi:hypothetical protein
VEPTLVVFAIQLVWFTLAWSAVAGLLVAPRLRGLEANDAIAVWTAPEVFRVLGGGLLVPALSPGMPRGFALPTVMGDGATAFLALLALFALVRRLPSARALAWACHLFGLGDLMVAGIQAARFAPAAHLAGQWYVAALGVPLMIVCHVMALRALWQSRRVAPGSLS